MAAPFIPLVPTKHSWVLLAVALLAFFAPLPATQALEPTAQAEIDFLLGFVEKSGHRFVRSGKEYSASEGAAHLRTKLDRAGSRVKTADDFITNVGTKSYLTGEAYLLKTADGQTIPTGPWLSEALAKHRQAKPAK